jgi:hypothetical protein
MYRLDGDTAMKILMLEDGLKVLNSVYILAYSMFEFGGAMTRVFRERYTVL